jgi:hypothetical protein
MCLSAHISSSVSPATILATISSAISGGAETIAFLVTPFRGLDFDSEVVCGAGMSITILRKM